MWMSMYEAVEVMPIVCIGILVGLVGFAEYLHKYDEDE